MLNINFKEIKQYKVFRIFVLMILSGAFCLLNVEEASAQNTDLLVTKTASATVVAGANIAYTITVTNNEGAPVWAEDTIILSDNTPTNTTFVSIVQNSGPTFSCSRPQPGNTGNISCFNSGPSFVFDVGQSAQFTLIVKVNLGTSTGTLIRNTASVGFTGANGGSDLEPRNNSATADTLVVTAPPTAASVSISGRVMNFTGRGIRNVSVTLTDSTGNQREAQTTSFGYYRFDDVAAGETVTITAKARRFRFVQSSIVRTTNESVTGADFVSEQ